MSIYSVSCGLKTNKPSIGLAWWPLSQLTRSSLKTNELSQKAQNGTRFLEALISSYKILQQHVRPTPDVHEEGRREFKIYDATVAKTSLKITSSSFSIYSVIMSVCLTFESQARGTTQEPNLEGRCQRQKRIFKFAPECSCSL